MTHLITAIAAGLFLTGAAQANTITVAGGGSLTCNGAAIGACQAFTGAGGSANGGEPTGLGVLSSANADTYTGTPSSEANEAARLNTLAGTTFAGTDGVRTNGGGGGLTFSTLRDYLVLRLGNDAVFVQNTSGGALNIVYTSSQARGLSHFTEFGAGNVVPLPGAAWLMIAGVAGLVGAQRRNTTKLG